MSVKPNTKTSSDTAPKAVNTFPYIKEVQRHKGIPQSMKSVLVHCLTQYQAKDQQGHPWRFSNGGIRNATGIGDGTIKSITPELRRYKVLNECGRMRYNSSQDKPTILHTFDLEAMIAYLKVKSGIEKSFTPNKDNAETPIEDLPKPEVKSEVKSANDLYKEDSTKKIDTKKEEEETSISTGETTLKDMEQTLNTDFYSKSGMPLIVSGPAFKSSKKRFSVPYGMDDKTTKPKNDWKGIEITFTGIVTDWNKQRVPQDIIQKRLDAFKLQADNVHSAVDVIRIFKGITEQEGK